MSGEALEIGQGALAKAMDLARKCERAAKVVALLVPLAAIAAQHHANAGASVNPVLNTNSGKGFDLPNGSGQVSSGIVSWTDTGENCFVGGGGLSCTSYRYDTTIRMSSGAVINEIDVPIATSGDITGVEFVTSGYSTGFGPDEFRIIGNSPQSDLEFVFDSNLSPVTENFTFDTSTASGAPTDGQVDPGGPGNLPTGVPEPATLSLLGMALIGFAGWRRRLTR